MARKRSAAFGPVDFGGRGTEAEAHLVRLDQRFAQFQLFDFLRQRVYAPLDFLGFLFCVILGKQDLRADQQGDQGDENTTVHRMESFRLLY